MSLKSHAVILPIAFLLLASVAAMPALNDYLIRPAGAVSDPTSTGVTPNPSTVTIGGSVTFTAKVTDTSSGAKTTPTGMASWSDGGLGGTFTVGGISSNHCTLATASSSASSCKITYKPPSTASGGTKITINATYSGDSAHQVSSGKSLLTVLRATSTQISQTQGVKTSSAQLFTALVMDTSSGTKSAPTGIISWKSNVTGGTFNSTSCTLSPVSSSSSQCGVTYTLPSTLVSFAITGTYSGDNSHLTSSGKAVDLLVGVTLSPGTCINGTPCYFNPMNANIKSGNNVIWKNIDSGVTHTVTSNTGLFSGVISPGNIFSHKFSSTGSFAYHCMIHPFMTGTVNVG